MKSQPQPQTHHNYNFYKSNTYQDVSTKIQNHLTQWQDSTKIDLPKLYSEFEYDNSFIQWLFPNFYQSASNNKSHALTLQERDLMIQDEQILQKLLLFYQLFLRFLGISVDSDDMLTITDTLRFRTYTEQSNRNQRKFQRVLSCLSVLGCRKDALKFLKLLKGTQGSQLYDSNYCKYEKLLEEKDFTTSRNAKSNYKSFAERKAMYFPASSHSNPCLSADILTRKLMNKQTNAQPVQIQMIPNVVKIPIQKPLQKPQMPQMVQSVVVITIEQPLPMPQNCNEIIMEQPLQIPQMLQMPQMPQIVQSVVAITIEQPLLMPQNRNETIIEQPLSIPQMLQMPQMPQIVQSVVAITIEQPLLMPQNRNETIIEQPLSIPQMLQMPQMPQIVQSVVAITIEQPLLMPQNRNETIIEQPLSIPQMLQMPQMPQIVHSVVVPQIEQPLPMPKNGDEIIIEQPLPIPKTCNEVAEVAGVAEVAEVAEEAEEAEAAKVAKVLKWMGE